MIAELLGSPDDFATAVAAELEGPDLPDMRELRLLVEVAFFASMHEEEGRRLTFTLAWTSGAGADRAVFEIVPPVRATSKNVAMLAPATSRDATTRIDTRAAVVTRIAARALEHEQRIEVP